MHPDRQTLDVHLPDGDTWDRWCTSVDAAPTHDGQEYAGCHVYTAVRMVQGWQVALSFFTRDRDMRSR